MLWREFVCSNLVAFFIFSTYFKGLQVSPTCNSNCLLKSFPKKNAAKNCVMLNAKHVKMQKIESSQNNKHCIFFTFQDVRRMICLRPATSHVTPGPQREIFPGGTKVDAGPPNLFGHQRSSVKFSPIFCPKSGEDQTKKIIAGTQTLPGPPRPGNDVPLNPPLVGPGHDHQ